MKRNFLDRVISFISPAAGLQRLQARAAETVLQQHGARRYEAAGGGRRTEGWQATSTGANGENRGAARTLRDRSRDLIRNNPYAKKANRVLGANVVGTGIRPAPTSGGVGVKKKARAAWKAWAETTLCDFDGRRTFYGLQRQVIRAVAESGEVLVVRRRLTAAETASNGGVPIQLQVLEADYLDSGRDGRYESDGSLCIQGVQFDRYGRRAGYWLYRRHPGDGFMMGANQSELVPAADVLHVYEMLRPGQVRGVPMGVSAMLRLKDFDDYEDAQLMRQKVAACFAVFYSGADADAAPAVAADTIDTSTLPDRVEPGMIERLPAGTNVTLASPPPADQYDEYSRRVLQGVAAGMGVTYEQLTGDLSNVNFTSGRMGRLEFEAFVTELQDDLMVQQFCAPVWSWFVSAAFAGGVLGVTSLEVKWTMPGRKMVDPVKEVKALTDAVRAGFISWPDAVLQQGNDPDELLAAIEASNKALDTAGVLLTTDPRRYTSAGNKVPKEGPPGGPTAAALDNLG